MNNAIIAEDNVRVNPSKSAIVVGELLKYDGGLVQARNGMTRNDVKACGIDYIILLFYSNLVILPCDPLPSDPFLLLNQPIKDKDHCA